VRDFCAGEQRERQPGLEMTMKGFSKMWNCRFSSVAVKRMPAAQAVVSIEGATVVSRASTVTCARQAAGRIGAWKLFLSLLVAVPSLLAAASAWSHSVDDLQKLLGSRERYFQALDKEAPDFALQDAEGRSFSVDDFHGKVVLLHFIYAACPDICPLHADRIAEVQKVINQTPMKDQVRFITITTDPVNDAPDVMRNYGEAHGLDSANWLFLTVQSGQAEDATRKLAERFGHKFTKVEGGYQIHSIVTHVIDRNGRWRANFHGLKFDPTNLVVFVNGLVNDFSQPHGHPDRSLWQRFRGLFGS
jgi:protein SCO1